MMLKQQLVSTNLFNIFIRTITQVRKSGTNYLTLTIAMVTKMALKIG